MQVEAGPGVKPWRPCDEHDHDVVQDVVQGYLKCRKCPVAWYAPLTWHQYQREVRRESPQS